MELEEMFFAARVEAFGATFDQLFFIVDNDSQHLLLGLPALVQAKLQLLTPDGTDLMPNLTKIFNLDVDVDSDQGAARMKLTKQLNSTAMKLRTGRVNSTASEFDPYRSLQFSKFGPACTGAAVPKVAKIADIDSGDEADCIEMQESTDGSDTETECNELGDELTPRTKSIDQVFDQNVFWRSSPRVAGPVQFSAIADGNAQDVRFQQSFQNAHMDPLQKSEENKPVPSAFQEKVPVKDEKPKTEPQKGKVHWLMAKRGKYIQSQQRTYLKCNFLQARFKPKQQLLVSGNLKSKVTALDTLVEVAPNKCQWLVVENRFPDTVHVKRVMEIAEVSLLEDVYDIPEDLVQQEKERREQEAQQRAVDEEIVQVKGIESEVKTAPLTVEERQERLHSSLSYNNPNLREEEKIHATELLLKNHTSFSLDPGELGRVRDIEVEIETGDARLICQSPRCVAYVVRDGMKKEIEKLLKLCVVKESNSLGLVPSWQLERKRENCICVWISGN